jgi:hypothetical protein
MCSIRFWITWLSNEKSTQVKLKDFFEGFEERGHDAFVLDLQDGLDDGLRDGVDLSGGQGHDGI